MQDNYNDYEEEYEKFTQKCKDRTRERMKIGRQTYGIDNYDKSPIREDDFESDIDQRRDNFLYNFNNS